MKDQKGWKLQLLCLFIMLDKAALSSNVPSECLNYKILSDETRSIDYFSAKSIKCDNTLTSGWYRFMGKSGTQLPERPVVNQNSPYRCSTHAISYMTQPHPRLWEGKVERTVCFHWGAKNCYISPVKIFVINCGMYFVYYLKRPPTCSFRYCANATSPVREQRTKVSCHENFMEIHLSRNFYNVSKFESITLKDKNCTARLDIARIKLGSRLNSCGTTRKETDAQIIYTNAATLVMKQGPNVVSRDHDIMISFSCAYNKDGYTNQTSFTPVSRITGNDSSTGSFAFELEMYKSQSFRVPHTSYPVSVKLNDKLYFQIKASVEDDGLVLLIDKCFSTPNMNRNDYRRYTFIEHGCPTDNTVQFHAADRQKQRFSIQAFRYLNNHSTVYVHCFVLLCQKSSTDSRCVSGCSGNNIHRVRRQITDASTVKYGRKSFSDYYFLEKGPVKLADKEDSTGKTTSDVTLKATMKRKKSTEVNGRKEIGIYNFANGVPFVGK